MDSLAPPGGFEEGSFIRTVPTIFPDLFTIVIVSMMCNFQVLVVRVEDQLHSPKMLLGGAGLVRPELRCSIWSSSHQLQEAVNAQQGILSQCK